MTDFIYGMHNYKASDNRGLLAFSDAFLSENLENLFLLYIHWTLLETNGKESYECLRKNFKR